MKEIHTPLGIIIDPKSITKEFCNFYEHLFNIKDFSSLFPPDIKPWETFHFNFASKLCENIFDDEIQSFT